MQCNNTNYLSDADFCNAAVDEYEKEEAARLQEKAVKVYESMMSITVHEKDVHIAHGAERAVGQKQRTTHCEDETDQRSKKKKFVGEQWISKTNLQGCSITVEVCLAWENFKGRPKLHNYIFETLKNKALNQQGFVAADLYCFCPEPARVQKIKYSVVQSSHYICSEKKCNVAVDVNDTQLPLCSHCFNIWTERSIYDTTHPDFSSFANILIESVGHSETYCTRKHKSA
jgi:hypothetical protein